jgi:hypothetical protein
MEILYTNKGDTHTHKGCGKNLLGGEGGKGVRTDGFRRKPLLLGKASSIGSITNFQPNSSKLANGEW